MSATSSIEWTDATWNPATGCTKVSPGCDHCYAETFAERWRGVPGHPYEQGFDLKLHPDRLNLPLTWRKPRRVFVNSMSDLFHVDIPEDYIAQVFDVMRSAPRHTFQVLTKRAERMERVVTRLRATWDANGPAPWWQPSNIWLGISVESPTYYSRIRHLRRTPAAVRFLSCEPLLAPLPDLPLDGIGWVIVGGESGPGARPMHPAWVRDIRDQCERAGVPFFFKQWGAWGIDCLGRGHAHEWVTRTRPEPRIDTPLDFTRAVMDGVNMHRVGKALAGRRLDGRTWDEFP